MADAQREVVHQQRDGAVLGLIIDNPPVNALSHAVRTGLTAGIDRAEADPGIAAVVIRALGRTFSAGADLAEFGKPTLAPALPEVCNRVEACPKPVVAMLHGAVLGGGLALALAAHLRLAALKARLGFPEVGLGLLPGAGGTQRVARLIGAEAALRLMLTGRAIPTAEALALGLLDRVVAQDIEAVALAMAQTAALAGAPVPTRARRDGMRDPVAYQAAVRAARADLRDNRLLAPGRIIDCVEAAQLLPFDQGLDFEAAALSDLTASPAAAALRHAFFAERRLARMPEARVAPRALQRLGVMGADADQGLVLLLLQAGYPVVLVDADRPALVAALEQIAAHQEQAVQAGTLSPTTRDADWARLTPALEVAALAEVDLVLTADASALAGLVEATRPGAVLVLLEPGEAVPGARAGDMLGLQMAPPGGRLAEVAVWQATAPDAVATVLALLHRLGLGALRVQGAGGVGARLLAAGRAAAAHLAAVGQDVAAALAGFGWPQLLPAATAAAALSPEAAQAIMTPVLAALANEGARLVGQGVVQRPSDIDAALIVGHGFPRDVGGPMHWADQRGLLILRHDLHAWAIESPEIWGAAPLIDDLIRVGRGFDALNRG
ncbi:MAG: enoyl-CoA hydratase-related protein [Pseudorhodobacter sp.]|nr:enoyl-CoA hydratase-related protein [Pseudorhodobacter sp.]